jgi:hypothetical protein
MPRSLTREVFIATTVPRSAARPPGRAIRTTTVPMWLLPVAIIATGLAYLTLASHEHGAAAPLEQSRRPLIAKEKVPAGAEDVRLTPGAGGAHPLPPAFSSASFRLGFLEFEDDPDASAK